MKCTALGSEGTDLSRQRFEDQPGIEVSLGRTPASEVVRGEGLSREPVRLAGGSGRFTNRRNSRAQEDVARGPRCSGARNGQCNPLGRAPVHEETVVCERCSHRLCALRLALTTCASQRTAVGLPFCRTSRIACGAPRPAWRSRLAAVTKTFPIALGLAAMPVSASPVFSCVPPFADLKNPTPAHFSNDAIAELERSYGTPEVRGLRAAIDAYLAGDSDRETAKSLNGAARSLLFHRFVLYSDERSPFGGYFLTVQFRTHSEAMYRAWVYPLSGGPFSIRAWDKTACNAAERRWLRIRYRDLSEMSASG